MKKELLEEFLKNNGPLLSIMQNNEPILRAISKEIENISDAHKKLCNYMMYTMQYNNGIGLAAPQVNIPLRIIIVRDVTPIGSKYGCSHAMINPEIIKREGLQFEKEGCLSIPGKELLIPRNKTVIVKYTTPYEFTEEGEPLRKIKNFRGLSAVVVQHEIDHLNGILMTDRNKEG